MSNKKLHFVMALIAAAGMLLPSCAPYHAQKGVTKFRQTGEASWYGPGFAGRKTANGERFNPGEMTAAHRTLPFGTTVRVTNLETGQSATVRINDRGPYAGGRIIDLSKAAAKKIGLIGSGVAPVEVRAVGPGRQEDEETVVAEAEVKVKDKVEAEEKILIAARGPVTRNGVEHLISVETGATPSEAAIPDSDYEETEDISMDVDAHALEAPEAEEKPKPARIAKRATAKKRAAPKAEPATDYSVDSEPF